jgi:murein DD-endopeptidase MepM/ murein hydrolase activator NlpD
MKIRKIMKNIICIVLSFGIVCSAELFLVETEAATNYVLNGKYGFFRHSNSTNLLYTSSVAHNNRVTARTYLASDNRLMWKLTSVGNFYHVEAANNSNLVLCLNPGTNQLELIDKSYSVPANNMQWEIISNGTGTYYLRLRVNNKYLAYTLPYLTLADSSSGNVWVFEPSTEQSSTYNNGFDKFTPPISSNGTNRTAQYNGHAGIDIASGGVSKSVFAVDSGFAVYKQSIGQYNNQPILYGYGNHVYLKGNNDTRVVLYAHFESFSGVGTQNVSQNEGYPAKPYITNKQDLVRGYQNVNRGQNLGLSGNTGLSDGVHLHFEARIGCTITPNNITGGTAISRDTLDDYYKIVGGKVG